MKTTKTVLSVLNEALGLPREIRRVVNGVTRTTIVTAIKRIERGEVLVNEHTCYLPDAPVNSGDYIRWGCVKYNKDRVTVG